MPSTGYCYAYMWSYYASLTRFLLCFFNFLLFLHWFVLCSSMVSHYASAVMPFSSLVMPILDDCYTFLGHVILTLCCSIKVLCLFRITCYATSGSVMPNFVTCWDDWFDRSSLVKHALLASFLTVGFDLWCPRFAGGHHRILLLCVEAKFV